MKKLKNKTKNYPMTQIERNLGSRQKEAYDSVSENYWKDAEKRAKMSRYRKAIEKFEDAELFEPKKSDWLVNAIYQQTCLQEKALARGLCFYGPVFLMPPKKMWEW